MKPRLFLRNRFLLIADLFLIVVAAFGSFALRTDSNRKILEYLAVIGFYGLPLDYLDRYPKEVAKVTSAQIRDAFSRRIRPENLVIVMVAGS